jgi:CRISPR system Cascade subunit CasD
VGDFQVTRGVPRANGERDRDGHPVVVTHEYLVRAVHKVALGGDLELLREIESFLKFPCHPFGLGLANCRPSDPVWQPGCLVATDKTPTEVLTRWPWHRPDDGVCPSRLRITTDLGVGSTDGELRHDYPISLDPKNRRHADRRVGTLWIPTKGLQSDEAAAHEAAIATA